MLLTAWIGFAGILPWLTMGRLLACSGLLLPLLLFPEVSGSFRSLLRRTRVLLLALVLLYGFATPGTAVFSDWPVVSPTFEGLRHGGVQVWRLVLILVSLAALLSYLGKGQLVAGLYALLAPLKRLNVPVDRFAVRLALVMGSVHSVAPIRLTPSAMAAELARRPPELPAVIEFEVPAITGWDVVFALCVLMLCGWLLW